MSDDELGVPECVCARLRLERAAHCSCQALDEESSSDEVEEISFAAARPGPARFSSSSSNCADMRRPNLRRISTEYQSRATPNQAAPNEPPYSSLRSISFGVCSSATSFSPEWSKAARGTDRVFLTDAKKRQVSSKALVTRMWDEDALFLNATTASSLRITIAVDTIDQCRSIPGGTRVLLSLSRPPTFERLARDADDRRGKGQQVGSFDEEHSLVVGYASRDIMIEFRTRGDFTAFTTEAATAGLPRITAQTISIESTPCQDETSLALLQSWLSTFDFRVAFQLEKLVRNDLLEAVKVMQLRGEVDELVRDRGVREAERTLAFFADSLSSIDASTTTLEGATTTDSHQVAGQKRSLGEITLGDSDSDSSDSDSSTSDEDSDDNEDDPDAVIIVGATLPYLRGLTSVRAAQTPIEELRTLLLRAIDGSSVFNRLSATADDLQLVRSVTVTPTRILLTGPLLADSITVVRTYGRPDCFLTVTFRQEDGQRLREGDSSIISTRFQPLMRQGFDLGGRSWSFLAWSSSGLKGGSCFFMSSFLDKRGGAVTPETIHQSIGDFSGTETAVIPAKYFARISQAFTSSRPTIKMKKSRILAIDDVVSHSGSIFSDGVGLISTSLAEKVSNTLFFGATSPKAPPTCFQIRLGAAKGMVQVDPLLTGQTVALRPSQIKFRSTLTHLEIAGTFSAAPGFLNRPLIKLLEDLGIRPQQFLTLQAQATSKIANSRTALASAITLLRDWGLAEGTNFIRTLDFLARQSLTRGAAFSNPFVARCLDAAVAHALREIKHSGRIPLPGCYNLVGVLDIDECLGPDEIYAKVVHGDGKVEYISGRIAISRSPTNHPGDCRVVQAVGKLPQGIGERIRGLHNCVVFSSQGSRSLPSKLAGGDLDGDVYLLLTEASGLVPSDECIVEPAAYDAAPVVKLDRPVEVKDGADFFFQYLTSDRTGIVAIRQLLLADAHPEGLFHPACLKLAQQHSDCVDAQKSGTFVAFDDIPKPPPRGWPDFLTDSAADSYRSSKALGQLYRAVDDTRAYIPSSFDSPFTVDPLHTMTTSISSMFRAAVRPHFLKVKQPSPAAITHFRSFLPSLSAELLKLMTDPARQSEDDLSEEALFLSVSLRSHRLQQSDRVESSRLRERVAMLFGVVRKVIVDGPDRPAQSPPLSTSEKASNGWAAWHAAVEEGEDRTRALKVEGQGGKATAGPRERLLGLRIWGWLALGIMVEQLELLEKENVEVITID
ncbi:hypothetical protein JCM10908_006066 [Rhodotorula pacifica]|uniref:RNA dependent RNA polymerase n=1 Tax=Rhodotorula pacifica TaxID=1495444 RepID=UPI00317121D5